MFEVKRVIVGQERMVERLVVSLLAQGHCLLEGVPGVAKTLAVETLARTVTGTFSRLQFTPDLVPSDIVGTRIYRPGAEKFDTELGPIMANFVLADEINRAPAKVQSALLEVMAERHVTIGGIRYDVPAPFLVLATQNPIESEGVYPLPEAQRDRFLMKIVVDYPTAAEEREIIYRMGSQPPVANPVLSTADLQRLQATSSRVFVHHAIVDYVVRLVLATRNPDAAGPHRRRAVDLLRRQPARQPRPDRRRAGHGADPRPRLRPAPGRPRHRRRRARPPHGAQLRRDRRRRARVARDPPGAAGRAAAAGRTAPALRPARHAPAAGSPGTAGCTGRRAAAGVRHRRRRRPRSGVSARREHSRAVASARPVDHGPSLDLHGADALLRRLELGVRNKLDGLLQGNYLGLVPGPGSEAGESRQYFVGDDVRRMDWPVTARTMTPHIRQTVADRELESWLVVDLSPSMDFGTGCSEKRELVLAAITAIVHLTVRGGNRVGADRRQRRVQLRHPGPGGPGARAPPDPPYRADAARGVVRAQRPRRHARGPAAAATAPRPGRRHLRLHGGRRVPDAPPPPWERALRSLSDRHQLLAVEILDPRELELPAAGLVTFVDTETGQQLEVQTSDPRVRAKYAAAAAAQRERIASSLRHAGAAHLQLRTDRDWISDVVRFVVARRQFVVGAVGAGVR